MKLFYLIFLSCLLFSEVSHAFSDKECFNDSIPLKRSGNGLSVEIFGNGMLSSFVYDRRVYQKKRFFINASAGIGLLKPGLISIPHSASINFGKGKNYFEMGISGSFYTASHYLFSYYQPGYMFCPLMIGYRHQPAKGLLIKAYLRPFLFYNTPENKKLHIYPIDDEPILALMRIGISFGFCF